MPNAAIAFAAMAILLAAPASAKPVADVEACLATASLNSLDLSPTTIATRDRLIHDPGQVSALIDDARAAKSQTKAQIELGVILSVGYLHCVDPTGYRAVTDYLKAHADNPVVAELQSALQAVASADRDGNGDHGGDGRGGGRGDGDGEGGGGGFGDGGGRDHHVSEH